VPNLKNAPAMIASLVPFIDPSGRNVMVLIAKCSYQITSKGLDATPDQVPISFIDTPVGGDGTQNILVPSDLADYKPVGEVIVIRPSFESIARALSGRTVSIRVGDLSFSAEARVPWPFGPLSRNHKLRLRYAGTYDEEWQKNRMPLVPGDFHPLFNQAAPQAQRARQPFSGDEHITIAGLYGNGATVTFDLPGKTVLVSSNVRQEYVSEAAKLDTILVWSDIPKITLIWRHVIRPRQKNEEVGDVSANFVRLQTAREFFG
jgi:hypothetical protein